MSLGRNVVRVRRALRWTARELAAETVRNDPLRREKTYRAIAQIETRGQRQPDRVQHTRLLPELADALQIAPTKLMEEDLTTLTNREIHALRASYKQDRPFNDILPLDPQVDAADPLQQKVISLVMSECRTDEQLLRLRTYSLRMKSSG